MFVDTALITAFQSIVDCLSYACAQTLGTSLLFKGNDFSQTDVNDAASS